ncbi:MAG: response regulator [Desulfobacteraceae bacterium]|nr:response regulator [Desulfobacteraceae bacterium]
MAENPSYEALQNRVSELEQARAERENSLQESERRYRSLYENAQAGLTKQLLAFARKQIIDPRVLDLNHTVETMLTMMRRLIGEDIHLRWKPAGKLRPVKMDVVMPDMNGRDLAEQLTALCPQLKFLFMSGYTANVIAHQGVLDEGVQFIQKPFSMKEIAVKVQNVLDGADDGKNHA